MPAAAHVICRAGPGIIQVTRGRWYYRKAGMM
jgi:hypothetical protein